MKSSRLLILFAAVSILIHVSVLMINIRPAEKKKEPAAEHLIPVDLVAEQVLPEPAPKEAKPERIPDPQPEPEPAAAQNQPDEPQPEKVPDPQPEPAPAAEPQQIQEPAETGASEKTESQAAREDRAVSQGTPNQPPPSNPFAGLLERIEENKKNSYPLRARKRSQEGTVYIQLILNENGDMISVEVSRASPYTILDSAAIELIKKIMETPYPHGLGKTVKLKIPITYQLD